MDITKVALRACVLVSLYAAAGIGNAFCEELRQREDRDGIGQNPAANLDQHEGWGRCFLLSTAWNAFSNLKDSLTVLDGTDDLTDMIAEAMAICTPNSAEDGTVSIDDSAIIDDDALRNKMDIIKGKIKKLPQDTLEDLESVITPVQELYYSIFTFVYVYREAAPNRSGEAILPLS